MPRENARKKDIDFLKLFKKSLALSFTALVFGVQTSYATNITTAPGYNANVSTQDGVTNITGGQLNGDTAFIRFIQFVLSQGDIANLIFSEGANRYVNLVDNQVRIDGIFNAMKNGNIGGDVIFVSPLGFIVGASGIVNVGSLQTITPTQAAYDNLIGLPVRDLNYNTHIANLSSEGDVSYGTEINGKIFSAGGVDIADGVSVSIGDAAKIISGFNENGFSTLKNNGYDFSKIVNAEGVVSADYLTNTGGNIKISTQGNIYSDGTNGLIQSTGDVSFSGVEIELGSKIKTDKNVDLNASNRLSIDNDIEASGDVKLYAESSIEQKENTKLKANKFKADSKKMYINGNITTTDGFALNDGLSGDSFVQGVNSEIVNTDSGNIDIKFENVTANKITNQAEGGNINFTNVFGDLVLQNTVKTTNKGSISVDGNGTVSQIDDSVLAFDSAKDLSFRSKSVGKNTQTVNVKVSGDVSVTGNRSGSAYIKGKDSNLNVSRVSGVQDLVLQGDKTINLTDRVVALNSIDINANEGVIQSTTSQLVNNGAGGISITNNNTGNIDVGNITLSQGVVDINNNASDGSVNINGSIDASNAGYVDIYSAGGYNQTGVITAYGNDASGNSVTLDVVGDASVGKITATNGIKLSAGSILLNNLLKSNSKVDLDATTGGIQQSVTEKTVDANTVDMFANGDIGSEEQGVVVSAGSGIGATSVTGGVSLVGDNSAIKLSDISSATDLRIIVTGNNGDIIFDEPLSAISGDVLFSTDNELNITSGINADGSITLTSNNGDIILGALLSGKDINLTANGSISQDSIFDSVTINALNEAVLTAVEGDVGGENSPIQLIAGDGGVTVVGNNVYLKSPSSIKIVNVNAKNGDDVVASNIVSVVTTDKNDGNIDLSGLIIGSTVNLDSAQGITQSIDGKTIDTTGSLDLKAGAGSIGETKGINFSAGSVSADASESVVLIGEDTDINTADIKAGKNIDLSTKIVDPTKGKGQITIANKLETANGYIKLDSAKTLNINNDILAGKSIVIAANGGINQSQDANITSGTAGGELGSGNISIANSDSGVINLYNVTANQGELSVVNNANADIVLNSVLHSVNSDVILNSAGNIVHNNGVGASIIANNNVILNAVNVGTEAQNIVTDAGGAVYSTSKNLYLKDTTGDLTLGVLDIGESATITSDGSILQDGEDRNAIISQGIINLVAVTGNIGSDSDALDIDITGGGMLHSSAIDINLSGSNVSTGILNADNNVNINTSSTNGSVNLNGNVGAGGDIEIISGNGITQTSGVILRGADSNGLIQIATTNGDISLLEVTNNNGAISIGAVGNTVLNSLVQATGGDITLDATGNVTQSFEGTSVITNKNINLQTNGNVGSSSRDLFVKTTGGTVTANSNNGSLYLTGVDTDLSASKITASKGNIDLTTTGTGNIIIDSALATTNGYVSLVTDNALNFENGVSASKHIYVNAKGGSVIQSGDKLALNAGEYIDIVANGDVGGDTNALRLNAGANVSVDGNNVYLKSPSKTINLSNVNSDGVVSVSTVTSGDINLNGEVSGTNITLDSAGAIAQASGKLINATGALDLYARGGSIGSQGNAVSFKATSVSADASDSVALKGENVNIDIDDITAGNSIDLTTVGSGKITLSRSLNATNGYINLDAADGLELGNYSLTAKDYIKLATGNGDIYYNALLNATDGYIDLDATKGKITQGTNGSLVAKTDIDLTAGNTIGENGYAIIVSALGNVKAKGSNVYLTSSQTLNLGEVKSSGEVSIETTNGNIDIKETISGNNITLDANGSIIQTPDTQTITATERLKLISQTGDIGTDAAIKFKAGSVEATATLGSVKLSGVETNINTSNITAANDISISTITSGDIVVDREITTGGNVTLDAADALKVNNSVTSTGSDVTLSADEDITLSALVKATNGTVTVDAGSSDIVQAVDGTIIKAKDAVLKGAQIGASGSAIDLDLTEAVTATGTDVYIKNSQGSIQIDNITAGNSVDIEAVGNITQKNDGDISINAVNDVTLRGSGATTIGESKAKTLGVNAGGTLSVTETQNAYITSEQTLNIGRINGITEVYLKTLNDESNLVLTNLINATNIELDSAGSILQNSDLPKIIDAGTLTFVAGKNIGEQGNAIDFTAVNSLSATASNGSIVLNSVGKDIDTSSIHAGNSIDLTTTGAGKIKVSSNLEATNGYINLDAADGLELGNYSLTAKDYIKLATGNGDIYYNALLNATDGYIDLDATKGKITQGTNGSLVAKTDIDLTAGNTIGENGYAIIVSALGNVKAKGSNVYLTSSQTLNLGEVKSSGEVSIETTNGNIDIKETISGNNITLDANGSIIQTPDTQTITATERLKLISQTGDIGTDAAIKFKAGSVEATATLGSVKLSGVETNINTSNITAANDISISTITSGDIVVDREITTGGNVTLDAADALKVNNSVTSTGSDVTLSADEDITLSALVKATNGTVTVDAGSSDIVQAVDGNVITGEIVDLIASNIGSGSKYLNISAIDRVNAEGKNIYIASDDANFNIGNINQTEASNQIVKIKSNAGNVHIKGLVKGNDVDITSSENITQENNSPKSIDATKLTMLAENNIGAEDNALDIKVSDSVNVTKAQDVYINGVENVLNTGNISANNAVISADNGLNLKGLITAALAKLTATKGDITQDSSVQSKQSIEATQIELVSKQGNIGQTNNAIDFKTSTLKADAAGSVVLNGVETNISTDSIVAGENIDLSTEESGNITIANEISTGGYIRLDSAGALNVGKTLQGSSVELIAQNGDVTLSKLVKSTSGNITIDAQNNIVQVGSAKVLDSAGGLNLTAGNSIGTDASSLVVSAVNDITLNATDVYLTGDKSSLTIASVNAERENKTLNNFNLKTIDSGDITVSDSVTANNVNLVAIGSVNTNGSLKGTNIVELVAGSDITAKNISGGIISLQAGEDVITSGDIKGSSIGITAGGNISSSADLIATNGLTMTANSIAHTGADKIIKSEDGVISIMANDGNIDLSADVKNTSGTINITNNSDTGYITVNNVDAGTSYYIANHADGMINIKGDLLNAVGSSIIVDEGANSGIDIASTSTINNNNGTLTISNSGQKGLNIAGNINNNISAGSIVDIINTNGVLKVTGNINNGLDVGSTNVLSLTNSGVDIDGNGLIFTGGTINNYGSLVFDNKNGEMTVTGEIDAQVGSSNTFKNSSDSDFVVNSIVKNIGNTLTYENSGNGSLILGKDAILTVGDSDVYLGVLNINNLSSASDSSLLVEGSIVNTDGGIVNLTNNGAGGISFDDTANIKAGDITVINNNGDIDLSADVTVQADNNLTFDNYANGNKFDINGLLKAKNVTINSNNSDVNIAHNKSGGNIVADRDVTINATGSNIVNSADRQPLPTDGVGIVAGNKLTINAKNAGKLDNSLNDVVNNGFTDVDRLNAINVSASTINANVSESINLRSANGLSLENISATNALLTAVTGNIDATKLDVDNLYLYAMADNGGITVSDMQSSNFAGEAGGNITINSSDDLYVESLLSRNESIRIDSNGNTEIREIAAPKDITINVNDEKLTIYNLGRVHRSQDIVPETVNLLVNDAKNLTENKNGKLDIYNAYVQNKVTMNADTITAQVYDISDSSVKGDKRVDKFGNVATGFHNANKEGQLLNFDIQGANTQQEDVGSTPHNPYYTPDENDKRASSVHLTIGDSVGVAKYGANFEKLYSDYAFIDSINVSDPAAVSTINVESGIIGKYGILRNNKLRLDIANSPIQDFPINKHYDDAPDKGISNKTSFNSSMFEDINIVDPNANLNELTKNYNPHRIVKNPDLDEKMAEISAKPADNSILKSDSSTGLRNINWVIRDKNDKIVGASNTKEPLEIKAVISVSKTGIVVSTDTLNAEQLKKGDKLHIDMKYRNVGFNVDGKVSALDGDTVQIDFVNADKITKNILMFVGMYQENL